MGEGRGERGDGRGVEEGVQCEVLGELVSLVVGESGSWAVGEVTSWFWRREGEV
jgi:hypothetical protein